MHKRSKNENDYVRQYTYWGIYNDDQTWQYMYCICYSDAIVMVVNDDMYDRTFYVRVGIGMLLLLIERTILWLFDGMMEEEVSRPL